MIKVSLCCFTAVHHRFEKKCVMQLYTQGQVERTSLVTNKVLLKSMCSLPFFFLFFFLLYSAQLPADAMPFPLLCTFYNVVRDPVTCELLAIRTMRHLLEIRKSNGGRVFAHVELEVQQISRFGIKGTRVAMQMLHRTARPDKSMTAAKHTWHKPNVLK